MGCCRRLTCASPLKACSSAPTTQCMHTHRTASLCHCSHIACDENTQLFHSDIDRLLDILHVSETDPVRDWKSRFEEEFKARLGKEDYVSSCVAGSERADHADAVTIVRFGVESLHGATDSSASLESERSNQAQENVVGSGDDDVENPAIHLVQLSSSFDADSRSCPENMLEATSNLLDAFPWYLPLYEVTFDETTDCIGEGAFGAVYKAVWLDHPVVVKYMGYEADDGTVSTELFQHEVRIWYQLWHPHIVQLYGACHIGKRYFVCEYAPNGSLTEYLLRHGKDDDRFLWQKLHEAALGLQYLHYRSIVHNDLKCDNVLVGADAKAKLIDFGLSSIPDKAEIMVNVRTMGAVHWKSPEYLAGGRPTFASDIYSFAMCILEAVAGDFPWGRKMNPSLVKFHVKKGRIPERPAVMGDAQWQLVVRMTSQDPLDRVSISSVVDILGRFADGDFDSEVTDVSGRDDFAGPVSGPSSDRNTQPWYIPLHDLQFRETDRIGNGDVYRAKWLHTPVAVRMMDFKRQNSRFVSAKLFRHEVNVWYQLTHPNVAKLHGASDVGKRYLVYEFALNGTLREYLKREGNGKLVWEKLYEVALGLQYLHGRNIVHNNLKCNNILVGTDGKAKVIDFGLSSVLNKEEIQVNPHNMGAVHWKSPEHLAKGRSSFASDIYSFGMCIVEAVTGKIPWARGVMGAPARFRMMKKSCIPKRPPMMTDVQWDLIERMTVYDPMARVKISYVVAKLCEIVQDSRKVEMP